MNKLQPITIAYGDGIGPEIMQATLRILKESGSAISIESIEIGEKLYQKGYTSGISEETWEKLAHSNVLLKAPITTPQGGGYKSLNVTLRKALGLYANIRPSVSYHPFVATSHPNLDLVIIRENEEDLYAGIEYRQTHNVYESLKLITRTGSEKIIRFAFEYAVKNNRKKVTCFSKDNIMKFSDGIFHQSFDKIAKEYPNIKNEHYIIDIGTAKLSTKPELFDVIVTSNLYGDIISDVTSEISGSVGLAGSANIAPGFAMFEAVHGSAPDIAGRNIANPSGLLNAAIMMLIHLGQGSVAALIENAWKKTLEDGIHTVDIYNLLSKKKVGTDEFARNIIDNLGQKPSSLKIAEYKDFEYNTQDPERANNNPIPHITINNQAIKKLVGVDIFLHLNLTSAYLVTAKVTEAISKNNIKDLTLQTISSKGLKLWPNMPEVEVLSDHWCCRFMPAENNTICTHESIVALLNALAAENLDFITVKNLYEFDGKKGYSLAQGE